MNKQIFSNYSSAKAEVEEKPLQLFKPLAERFKQLHETAGNLGQAITRRLPTNIETNTSNAIRKYKEQFPEHFNKLADDSKIKLNKQLNTLRNINRLNTATGYGAIGLGGLGATKLASDAIGNITGNNKPNISNYPSPYAAYSRDKNTLFTNTATFNALNHINTFVEDVGKGVNDLTGNILPNQAAKELEELKIPNYYKKNKAKYEVLAAQNNKFNDQLDSIKDRFYKTQNRNNRIAGYGTLGLAGVGTIGAGTALSQANMSIDNIDYSPYNEYLRVNKRDRLLATFALNHIVSDIAEGVGLYKPTLKDKAYRVLNEASDQAQKHINRYLDKTGKGIDKLAGKLGKDVNEITGNVLPNTGTDQREKYELDLLSAFDEDEKNKINKQIRLAKKKEVINQLRNDKVAGYGTLGAGALGILGTGSLIENATRPDDYPIMDTKDAKYLY